jgi:hypothetical protein
MFHEQSPPDAGFQQGSAEQEIISLVTKRDARIYRDEKKRQAGIGQSQRATLRFIFLLFAVLRFGCLSFVDLSFGDLWF